VERVRYRSEVRRVRYYGLHTVCHLGGGGPSGAVCCDAGTWSGWGVWSATAYTQFATWAAADDLAPCAVTRAHEAGEAYGENVGNKRKKAGRRV